MAKRVGTGRADEKADARLEALRAENERLRAALAEAEARAAALAQLAESDPLTGLVNRRGLLRALKSGLALQRRHGGNSAAIFIDLDDFKQINDRSGHAAGDDALRRVAQVLAGETRASDIVSRLGGDEFVVVLWHCTREDAETKARALAQRLEDGAAIRASAGVVAIAAGEAPEAALARADAAMYAEKRRRREEA